MSVWTSGGARLVVALAIVAGIVGGARYVDANHVSVPLVHPYPPPGMEVNPLNPRDRADLVNIAEATAVKADFARDNRAVIDALAHGDPARADTAVTGNERQRLLTRVLDDQKSGLVEVESDQLLTVAAGRRGDPGDPTVTWCVHATGTATVAIVRRSDGATVQTIRYGFDGTYWLARAGNRYELTDSEVAEHRV